LAGSCSEPLGSREHCARNPLGLPTKSRVKAVNPRIPALRGNYKQKTLRISRTQGLFPKSHGFLVNHHVPHCSIANWLSRSFRPCVFFHNVSWTTTAHDLKRRLQQFGTIEDGSCPRYPGEPGGTRGTLPQTNNMGMGQNLLFEGSLEVKLPTIWTDEKQSREEAEKRERLEERRSEEKESEDRRCRCAKR